MSRGAGFTLVEVVVVLLVLGIVAAVATPGLPELGEQGDPGVRSVVGVLEEARRQATRRGRPVELAVEARRYTIRLASPAGPAGRRRAGVGRPSAGDSAGPDRVHAGGIAPVLRSGRLDPSVRVLPAAGAGWTEFRFRPGGRARGPWLQVWTEAGRTVTLSVEPWSGRVVTGR